MGINPITSLGTSLGGTLHRTTDYQLLTMMLWRLRQGRCSTRDPGQAELFVVPILARPKLFRELIRSWIGKWFY